MNIFAIDPGTGKSSPTAIALFDPLARTIAFTKHISTEMSVHHHRLSDLRTQFDRWMKYTIKLRGAQQLMVACETFVMRGKGGETLQRVIGSYEATVPLDLHWREVYNTTVKKIVGGKGDADKLDVGIGVRYFFQENESSWKYVDELIRNKEWDRTDALAIGIAAWVQEAYLSEAAPVHLAAAKDFERADRKVYSAALRLQYEHHRKALEKTDRKRKR